MDHEVIDALREAGPGHDAVGVDLDRVITRGRARRRRRARTQAGSVALASAAVLAIAVGLGQRGSVTGPPADGDRAPATRSVAPTTSSDDQGNSVDWGACIAGRFSSRHDLVRSGVAPYWLHLCDAVDPQRQHLACNGHLGGSPGHGMHFGGYYTIGKQTSDIMVAAFRESDDGGGYAESYLPEPCGPGSGAWYGDLTCETVPSTAGGRLEYGQLDGPHGPTRVASYHAPDGKVVVFVYTPDVDFANLIGAEPMTTTPVTRGQALAIVTDPFFRHW